MIRDKREECLPNPDPVAIPDYTEQEAQALRAVHRGEADARQQVAAMDYMIRAFGTHDVSYRPGDAYATAFAEGRRRAGTILIHMLTAAPTKTDPDKLSARGVDDDARPDNRQ